MEALNLDFKKSWSSLKRRWLPAVIVFSSTVTIAIVYASLQKSVYKAQGTLLLKKIDQSSVLTGVGGGIGQLSGVNIQKSDPLKTEAEVIDSVPLMQQTVFALNLKDEKGKPLDPEALAHQVKVKELSEDIDVLQLSYSNNDPKEAAAVVNTLMRLYLENDVLNNRVQAKDAGAFLTAQLPKTEVNFRQAASALRQFREQNHIVDLSGEAKSAVAVVQDLESKINETQAQLADTSARLVNLQNQVGVSSEKGIVLNSLNQSSGVQDVLQELQKVENQLIVERTRFLEDHPTIVDLKLKQATLRSLLKERIRQLGSVPQSSDENLQIGGSKQKLNEDLVQLEIGRSGLSSRLTLLQQNLVKYKQRVGSIPKLEQQEQDLERRLEVAQSTNELLLKRLQEVKFAENQHIGNARILNPATVPKTSSNLKKTITLIFGSMLGTLLAAATVAILEIKDTSIKTLKEVKELFGYTFVGAIPSIRKKAIRGGDTESIPELLVRDTPRLMICEAQAYVVGDTGISAARDTPQLMICEAYSMLQANLEFLSSDKPLKVIVITSSVPKEGKSKISANLAATMAQLGHKVLLVDADLRHPSQHHIWKLTNTVGLSDVIIGQTEVPIAINKAMTNLSVLTAGLISPNPTVLLNSKRLAAIISDFSETYDFVIIDAPPLLTTDDALILGKMADGILFVVRPGVLDSNRATAAKEILERSGQNVLGLVVNDVVRENEPNSYVHYAKEYSFEADINREQVKSNN